MSIDSPEENKTPDPGASERTPKRDKPSDEERERRRAQRRAKREAEKSKGDAKPAREKPSEEERERRRAERKAARDAAKAEGGGRPERERLSPEEREKRRAERRAKRAAAKAEGEEKPARDRKKERPARDEKKEDRKKKKKKAKAPAAVPERKFMLTSSPHIHDNESVRRIMWTVTFTLVPATLGATWVFGFRALVLVLIGAAAAVATEWAAQKLFRAPVTIADGSAVLTGVLVSFNLPPGVPWWIPVVGSLFAIGVAKLPFGGLGWNPLNPALAGRAFLLASWPLHMTKDWLPAFWWKTNGRGFFQWNVNPFDFRMKLSPSAEVDAVTYATPLELHKNAIEETAVEGNRWAWDYLIGNRTEADLVSSAGHVFDAIHSTGDRILDLIVGLTGGCIGETSAVLLLIGAAYLFYKGYIDWRTPFSFIAVTAVGGWLFGGPEGLFTGDAVFHIFAGGLILGAFYMATDMVTTPITRRGRLIFGAGCGLITVMIRLIGGYPEGVSYSILLMNLATPLIDRYTHPRRFGHVKKSAGAAAGGIVS
ncbi:MAG: Electron transport complex subunit RsxD [Calditrichaeota bacterium]|nr:Electron transport complex subunit RsxD [Calditrichota bacterium]